jgi:hypothetical protein
MDENFGTPKYNNFVKNMKIVLKKIKINFIMRK